MRNSECIFHPKNSSVMIVIFFIIFSFCILCPCKFVHVALTYCPKQASFLICSCFFLSSMHLSLFPSEENTKDTRLQTLTQTKNMFQHFGILVITMLSRNTSKLVLKKVATFFSSRFWNSLEYPLLLKHLITICHDYICSAFV